MTNSSRLVGTIVLGLGTVCLGTCTPTSNTLVSAPSGSSETDIAVDLNRMADQFLNVQELDPFVYDLTEDEAYRWQAEFVAALQPNLGRIAGYKTGGHDTGPSNPHFPPHGIRGVLLEGMVHPSGASVTLNDIVWGFLEADFAVRVGDESINTAETDLELLASLDAVIPFIEIPDPAFRDNQRSPTGSIVTNMASRYAFVGEPIPIKPTVAWINTLNTMTFAVHDEHGTEVGSGTLDGHYRPLTVVRWLRDHLRTFGRQLEPGHLLSLGTLSINRQLKPGSPQGGPAYKANQYRLSYYGLSEDAGTVVVNIER
ncbi:MAG TPA: hypothetical protein EYN90_06190 [Acidobacteria bacterium]|nr:hypothetical protein [Acidobacteriota bacterium]HIN69709.1 hypothetical protein [Acidobacteriota bacterium]